MTQSSGRVMSRRRSQRTLGRGDGATAGGSRGTRSLARRSLDRGRARRGVGEGHSAERRGRSAPAHDPGVRAHLAAGSAGRALTLGRELVEGACPGPARAEALALLGDVENAVDVSTGVDLYRQALREPDLPPELELELHLELAQGLRITEGLRMAEAEARRAVALAAELGSDLLEARTLATLAVIRFNQGEPEAFALAQQAIELALPTVDAATIGAAKNAWGHCLFWSGRIDEARTVFEAIWRSAAGRNEPAEAEALWFLALVEERAGQLALAREHAVRSRELTFQYAGHELDEPATHVPLARIAAHQGDVALARDLAARAYAYAEAQGGMSTGRAALALLGTLDLWAGEPLRALERFEIYAEQAAAASFSTSIAIHIADHVEALIEVGRTVDALALLERWAADARKLGHLRAPAEIARCRGLVAAADGEIDRAIELLGEAVTLHEEAGDPFGRARALLLLGSRADVRARSVQRVRRSRRRSPASRRSARRVGRRRRGGARQHRRSDPGGRADAGRAAGCHTRRRGAHEPRGRGLALPRRAHRRDASLARLREARDSLEDGARPHASLIGSANFRGSHVSARGSPS